MALHFDFSKVTDNYSVITDPHDETQWHPVADGLVWLSMICGFNRITQANHGKIASRIAAYQQVCGAYLLFNVEGKPDEVYITPADVERFIGMSTNASLMTDAQWLKRLGTLAMDNARSARRQIQSALDIIGVAQPKMDAVS